MALARLKTWVKETLTFQDLNAEFNNILNNSAALISPATATWDLDGNTLLTDADGDSGIVTSTNNQMTFQLGGAAAYIMNATQFDLTGKLLDLDDDNDTSISAAVDDTIQIEIGGSNIYTLTATTFDFNAQKLILDADDDSSLTVDTDDVLHMELQGFDAFIFDGDVANPLNGITFTSSATGVAPSIIPHGETNVSLAISPKAAGTVDIDLNAGELVMDADGDSSLTVDTDDVLHMRLQGFDAVIFNGATATLANGLTFTASDAGNDVSISAHGEANTSINLVPAGTGTVKINGTTINEAGVDFESDGTDVPAADTVFTIPHGLGAIPKQVWGVLECTTGDLGYSIGDEVNIANLHTQSTFEGMTISADATNIYVVEGATSGPLIQRKDAPIGNPVAITKSSWAIVVRARTT
jgi:hypothetical protein